MWVRVAVGIALWLLPTILHAQDAARMALLIGNQSYSAKVGSLKNPHNDVDLIEASLKRLGFKVTVLKDASYRNMDIALKRYVTEVRRAGRSALSFFYYSGHGVANPETQINYLIPVDVSDTDDETVWFASFQQNTILDLLSKQALNATHYVVFDACRNELNIGGTAAAKALGTDKGFVPIADTSGLLIAYATAPRKTASDVGDHGGPYAKILAEELTKPGIEAVTMFRNVQLRVKQTIGQDPWLSFPSLPAVYLAGSTQSSENAELAFWASVKDSTNPTLLNTYLQRYPAGEFAPIARAMMEHYERLLRAEQAAHEKELRRQDEVRKAAELKRLEEERKRLEVVAQTEERRKAQEALRVAREAVAVAEEQRLAAVRAAEEAKERVKLAGLPPSPNSEPIAHDPAALARTLQAELARVGCNPGAVDGRWGAQAKEALAKFARLIQVSLTVDEPTPEALNALKEQKRPICSATCGAGEIETNGKCVAKKVHRKSDHQAERAKNGTQETGKSSGGMCFAAGGNNTSATIVPCDHPSAMRKAF
jgi:hypothetical protein